ncbi:MAG TPA: helix-turn-helix domain-containing protein [Gammaproteobacteria bacterium]
MAVATIPTTTFRSVDHPSAEQFEAWRERISVVFDVAPLRRNAGPFAAEAHAFHLGEIVLVRTRFDGQRFSRTLKQLRSDLLDHYLVQLYRKGGYTGEADGRRVEIRPGAVSVLDMAQPLETRAVASDCTTLVVPRDVMHEALACPADLHGVIVPGASGGLLADYIVSLERRLPELEREQAPHVVRATSDLLAACLRPTAEHRERARDQLRALQLQQVTRFIDERLGSRDLSPERICAAVGLSRTTLYELLKPRGGVQRYVQARRLLRVHAALADPTETRPIMELAADHGFTSHAHLTRAFREHFGYPPSEVRRNGGPLLRALAGGRVAMPDAGRAPRRVQPQFDDWVRALRA